MELEQAKTTTPEATATPTTTKTEDEVFSQAYDAFFRPRSHKFETIDFRLSSSLFNKRNFFASSSSQQRKDARVAGLLGILIGAVVSVAGFIVDQMSRGLTIGLYEATQRILDRSFWGAFFAFNAISVLYVLIPAILVIFVAPLGAGSGIPELKATLNGVRVPGFLSFKSFFVKVFGIPFTVSAGLICGRQGPIIHAGAIVGAAISQAASSTFKWRLKSSLFRPFRTEAWKRDFIAVGGAVGIAVAFGTPMGAWLWVYEEACTHWSWELGIITLSACMSGAIITRIFNYLASGLPNGGFGSFSLTQIGKLVTPFDGTIFPLKDIVGFLLIGIVGGAVGAILSLINRYITLFRYKHITKPSLRILEAIVITVLTASIKIIIPYINNGCQVDSSNPDDSLSQILRNAPLRDFSAFNCPDGQFSSWAATIYNPTDSILRGLLFDSTNNIFHAGILGVTAVYLVIFMIWSYGMAVPAGVFFPGLLLGGIYGRLIGVGVQAIFPQRLDVSLTGYAFLGAVSAVAGITRTISVAVIAMEATANNNSSYATIFVALVSKLVADLLYKEGIYDLHVGLKGMPFLTNLVPKLEVYSHVLVSEVMSSSVTAVKRRPTVAELVRMLKTNNHHSFPVFFKDDNDGVLEQGTVMGPTSGREGIETSSNSRSSGDNSGDNSGEDTGQGNNGGDGADKKVNQNAEWGVLRPSSIVMPTKSGMNATIFDGDRKFSLVIENENQKMQKIEQDPLNSKSTQTTHDLDIQLLGMIDRSTLLTLLKHELNKNSSSAQNEISREHLDAAWPNPSTIKGNQEKNLIEQIEVSNISEVELDLKIFVDTDPLLIADVAPTMTAYRMFRKTGTRHMLVANMRSGRVCGMLTRKDILEESVQEAFERKRNNLETVQIGGSKTE